MNTTPSRIPNLLVTTLVLVFVLVVWGGVVRLSGSGLAIPDWPLAEGKVIPKPQINIWIEYIHRVLAGAVGLLTVGIAIALFRHPVYRPRLGGHMWAALAVLGVQIFYGARVVLEELPVDRVVTHLLLAFLFFAILLRMTLRAQDIEREEPRRGAVAGTRALAAFSHAAAGVVFLQAGLGAWVSSSGAALACPDFPTCHGSWFPKLEGLVGIHYTHRLGGYAVFLVVTALLLVAARAPLPPRARWPLRLAGVLVSLQVVLGIGNVVLGLPLVVSAGHLATALMLFGTLLVANHELARL
jgi:cytochrome c oxidase assembly protein subunit 15